MFGELRREDYDEPQCLLCETDPQSEQAKIQPIPTGRVIEKLDALLGKNDYDAARRHLLYWLKEAEEGGDRRGQYTICNELMGLYRKLGQKEEALRFAARTLLLIEDLGMQEHVSAATAYVNAATVKKAFGLAFEGLPLFERAKTIYEANLSSTDGRLAGLYNNMALALAETGRTEDAQALFEKAFEICMQNEYGQADAAVTLLNLANLTEQTQGLLEGNETILAYLDRALELLNDKALPHDGQYAFVCEKCAPTFGYYGYFAAKEDLLSRARRIYEGA